MNKAAILASAIFILFAQPAKANAVARRATITGGGGWNGSCTVEVNVDGAAEVEISGDHGLLRTLSGQNAAWRRFQCSASMPRNPNEFRFTNINGRGSSRLLREPRGNGGTAVIHINDPQAGRDRYTFELRWRGNGGGGWTPGPGPAPPGPPPTGPWPGPGGFPASSSIQNCQDSVTGRLNRDGYRHVSFERIIPADNPGRHDWVTGTVSARRESGKTWFSFSCSVDFRSGQVRSVDVRPRQ